MTKQNVLSGVVLGLVFLLLAVVFVRFFEAFPTAGTSLGIDNIAYELDDWDVHYTVTNGLRNPPWSVLLLVPIASSLSGQATWGLLVLVTILVTIVSVPRTPKRWLYLLSVFLAALSFPTLRNLADANLEGFVIAGVLLILSGYRRQHPALLAFGGILATTKPQLTWLLVPVVGLLVLQTWPRRSFWACAALIAAVVVPTFLWRGGDWLAAVRGTYQAGSIIDISLSAALHRTGRVSEAVILALLVAVLALTIAMVWRGERTLSRDKTTLLICASMLTAPYVAGNSIATILAIGLIPLLQDRPLLGGAMFVLVNAPFVWSREWLFAYHSYWSTFILLLTWGIMGWRVYTREARKSSAGEAWSAVERQRQ